MADKFLAQLMRGDVPLDLLSVTWSVKGCLQAVLGMAIVKWGFSILRRGGQQKGHLGLLDRHWLDKVERVLSEAVLKGKGVQGGWKYPKEAILHLQAALC